MLNHLLFIIQTEQQLREGEIMMVILLVGIFCLIIWYKTTTSGEKRRLMNKLQEGKVTWDDYYDALNKEYDSEAYQIKKFLDKQDADNKREVAEEMSQSKRWENSDYNVKNALSQIENKTHKCNKCFSDYMRIWNLNSTLVELRCENCKKKFTYMDESIPNVNFDELVEDLNLLYDRYEKQEINPFFRKINFEFNFEGQKSNSPNTYPITLNPSLEPMKGKTKAKSILPEENDARSRRITQEVKDKVWNRDGGKCVECGSNQNLEFDHIIPFSKGGANTYRNLQLLCEPCNRSKSASIC